MTGLDKFLARVYPRVSAILEQNARSDLFEGYDVIWEDDTQEATEMTIKLETNFDFVDANSANKQTNQKLKEAESKRSGGYDDEFQEFDDS